jgi:tetratricopeptide (TPR) repeat protein
MTGKYKFVGLFFLICTILFSGCDIFDIGKGKGPRVGEVKETPTEKRKAELFQQIERKFESPDAHFELGQLYHADGMWTQAEYHYNTSMSFDPVNRDAQAAMVKVLSDSGETAKSEVTAEIYMNQVFASAEDSLVLGLAFQKQGLDEYAMDCYRQALHLAPNSAKINRQIGYYYLSKNNKVQAQEYLMRSFQLNPNQPEVAGELGRLGVAVRIPRKTEKSTGKLDKLVEKTDEELSK